MWRFLGKRQEGVGWIECSVRVGWESMVRTLAGREGVLGEAGVQSSGGLISWGFIHFSVGDNVVWGFGRTTVGPNEFLFFFVVQFIKLESFSFWRGEMRLVLLE